MDQWVSYIMFISGACSSSNMFQGTAPAHPSSKCEPALAVFLKLPPFGPLWTRFVPVFQEQDAAKTLEDSALTAKYVDHFSVSNVRKFRAHSQRFRPRRVVFRQISNPKGQAKT